MLRINPIKNVNNTLKTLSFKSGTQTNFGVHVASRENSIAENSLFTSFYGVIEKAMDAINEKVNARAKSIKEGLDETKKLNKVA